MKDGDILLAAAEAGTGVPHCRFCGGEVHEALDLGMSPLCESFVPSDRLNAMEPFYPLRLFVCGGCFLVQLDEYVSPKEIFTEYAYFSSYSDAYVAHGRDYADMIVRRLGLGPGSQVVELASNDGYLLRHFIAKAIPVLGVEPAANVARVAIDRGIPTEIAFFDAGKAARMRSGGVAADLIIGNNVLAQVPNLNSFVAGIANLLAPLGVATLEFPHVVRLIEGNQYDTIYHEHFSYFSLLTTEKIFAAHGLRLFDVEELWTHGGSLRIYLCHGENGEQPTRPAVDELRARERAAGYDTVAAYSRFGERVRASKRRLLDFLIHARESGRSVVGYGAPGKGNTLLNYCGIRTDFIDYVVDRNPYKHGKFLPGTHIPIQPVSRIDETRPDYLMVLPWNLKDEIMHSMSHVREWGCRFVIPIPEVSVCP